MHVSGYFHMRRGLGILEHLLGGYWQSDLSVLTVAVIPEDDPASFSMRQHLNFADLVALSDINQL